MPRKITRLLIVGASVRAAVFSAIKAGYQVDAFDFFADWDTRQFLTASDSLTRISTFEDMSTISAWQQCDVALISGGFENRIELVAELESQIPVLGVSSIDLLRLADVPHVFGWLRQNGIQAPESKPMLGSQDDPDNWLLKNAMTAGGLGVELATDCQLGQTRRTQYFQKRKLGCELSAAIVATVKGARMIGATLQLVGHSDKGASEFQYCGSVSLMLSEERIEEVEKIANVLAKRFGLRGLFGFDFIQDGDGFWPIDINPRLSASMELFESMFNRDDEIKSLVDLHVKACQSEVSGQWLQEVGVRGGRQDFVESKVILFNQFSRPICISDEIACKLQSMANLDFYPSGRIGNTLADLPLAGELIQPGHPILTLRCRKTDHLAIEEWNNKMSDEIYSLLFMPSA